MAFWMAAGVSGTLALLLSGCSDEESSKIRLEVYAVAGHRGCADLSANLLRTLKMQGVNDAVQLTFWPTGGGFYSAKDHKYEGCPHSGNDRHCIGDMYESCLLSEFCGGPSCPPREQLQLLEFLECFEHEHDANMSFADSCASAAGFDTAMLRDCFDHEMVRLTAYQEIADGAKAAHQDIPCFPWVALNGQALTSREEGCLDEDAGTFNFFEAICNASHDAGYEIDIACNGASREAILM